MRSGVPLVVALCLLPGVGVWAEESCRTCHPDRATEYQASVHDGEFGCTACHGGDPADVSLASHSVAKKYVGTPARAAIPRLCASCHADPSRMKAFGLPTDQYAQYQTSGHGQGLARGDTHVAVCTDCHGAHRILPHGEPTNPVSAGNVTATCGRCHSNEKLMAAYELPADQVEKFRSSVHGIALLVDGHRSAPACPDCHGKHGAIAPQGGSISAVCGHCHARTREYFNESPHQKAAAEAKMSECVSCHGYHDIAPPTRRLFDTACAHCHEKESAAFGTGQKLKTLLSRAEESIAAAGGEMARVEKVWPTVARYRPRLRQARAYFMEALPVQHALATDRVESLARQARFIAEEVRASAHGVEEDIRLRYIFLGFAWAFILFVAATAYLYKRQRLWHSAQRQPARAPGAGANDRA